MGKFSPQTIEALAMTITGGLSQISPILFSASGSGQFHHGCGGWLNSSRVNPHTFL